MSISVGRTTGLTSLSLQYITETEGVQGQTPVELQSQPSKELTYCLCSGQTEYGGPGTTQTTEVRRHRDLGDLQST